MDIIPRCGGGRLETEANFKNRSVDSDIFELRTREQNGVLVYSKDRGLVGLFVGGGARQERRI